MSGTQLRLFPSPQPLVERLGADWFRSLPTLPGVYRFLDADNRLLYVGKARNLRQRLAAYRSTHRHHPRIVRLIHSASRIEWEILPSEAAALTKEAEAILRDQPRFNRAGRWKAPPVWLRLQPIEGHWQLDSSNAEDQGRFGPRPQSHLRSHLALARLLWLCSNPSAQASEAPLSIPERSDCAIPMLLPAGPSWANWLQAWVADGNPSILWEVANLLEPRIRGFTGAWILDCWDRAARAAHPAPSEIRTG